MRHALSTHAEVRHTRARRLSWRRCAASVVGALREVGLLDQATVVLLGSFARDVDTSGSDVDILVLLPYATRLRPRVHPAVHLHVAERSEFQRRVIEGDDFALSCARLGRPLHDQGGFWKSLAQDAAGAPWPDWRSKLTHARQRLRLGNALAETGDADAAGEEYLFAATQVARALLLRAGVLPLSRPELSEQLARCGRVRLAAIIQALRVSTYDEHGARAVGSEIASVLTEEFDQPQPPRSSDH